MKQRNTESAMAEMNEKDRDEAINVNGPFKGRTGIETHAKSQQKVHSRVFSEYLCSMGAPRDPPKT